MLKAEAWPLSRKVPRWQAEARQFRGNAARRMRRIDLTRLYRRALRAVPETIVGQPPLPRQRVCTVTLDKLLSDGP